MVCRLLKKYLRRSRRGASFRVASPFGDRPRQRLRETLIPPTFPSTPGVYPEWNEGPTAALLRKEAGDDLHTISSFLGHSNLSITQIYLHKIENHQDTSWLKVEFSPRAFLTQLIDIPP